jgi:hypothetical protein
MPGIWKTLVAMNGTEFAIVAISCTIAAVAGTYMGTIINSIRDDWQTFRTHYAAHTED